MPKCKNQQIPKATNTDYMGIITPLFPIINAKENCQGYIDLLNINPRRIDRGTPHVYLNQIDALVYIFPSLRPFQCTMKIMPKALKKVQRVQNVPAKRFKILFIRKSI